MDLNIYALASIGAVAFAFATVFLLTPLARLIPNWMELQLHRESAGPWHLRLLLQPVASIDDQHPAPRVARHRRTAGTGNCAALSRAQWGRFRIYLWRSSGLCRAIPDQLLRQAWHKRGHHWLRRYEGLCHGGRLVRISLPAGPVRSIRPERDRICDFHCADWAQNRQADAPALWACTFDGITCSSALPLCRIAFTLSISLLQSIRSINTIALA